MTTSNTEESATLPDEQLMRYLDGELDEQAEAELIAKLDAKDSQQSEDARDKLAGLAMTGDLLREAAEQDERGDTIADGVMSEIAAGLHESVPSLNVVDLDEAQKKRVVPIADKKPANDNARNVYMLAAGAAAVAAGLILYSRTPVETPATATKPTAAATAEAAPAPTPAPGTLAASDADEDEAVEIAAVDFGSGQSGSVFHISGGDTAAATTVLWVTDSGD